MNYVGEIAPRNKTKEETKITINITDVHGRELTVDSSRKKLYVYENINGKTIATWSAPIIEGDGTSKFWTDYVETVDRITYLNQLLKPSDRRLVLFMQLL